MSRAIGPSVIQVRTQDLMPAAIGNTLLALLQDHSAALASGAIITLDLASARVRILPIQAR